MKIKDEKWKQLFLSIQYLPVLGILFQFGPARLFSVLRQHV